MAHVEHQDAGGEVDVFPPVGIPHLAALRSLPYERGGIPHAVRGVFSMPIQDLGGKFPWERGLDMLHDDVSFVVDMGCKLPPPNWPVKRNLPERECANTRFVV
jgi:hypothetical protein